MSDIKSGMSPDGLAADAANLAATSGAWESYMTQPGEASSDGLRAIQERARILRESETFESDIYNDEELFGAIGIIRSMLRQEYEQPEPEIVLKDGEKRDRSTILADEHALALVDSSLREGNSFELARKLIAEEGAADDRPALAAIGRTRYGAIVWSGAGAKNILPDGSLSPLPRYEHNGVVLCEDYYVTRRAEQYLDYIESHPAEIKNLISAQEQVIPPDFHAPLFEVAVDSMD